MKQFNVLYSSSNKKLETRISNYRLDGVKNSEPDSTCCARQERGKIQIGFWFTRVKEGIFHATSDTFFKSFLSPRTNCGKTGSYFGSEQRFSVKCSKLLFQFSITSDLKGKGNGTTKHVVDNH